LEHVPAEGGILVIANHLHNADPVLLTIAFPRPLHFMAKKELFGVPLIGWVIRRVGAFPVDRGKADRGAFRRADAILAQGIAVGMFPEGTRSTTGGLGPAHSGAALLALRARVPVLPVTIVGSERLPFGGTASRHRDDRRGSSGMRPRLEIRIGPPFTLPSSTSDRRTSVHEASERLMTRLAEMLPPEYRGHYGNRRALAEPGLPGEE
jgi:1-acyl-sn-glycerol-3-phosphate acyltransferase